MRLDVAIYIICSMYIMLSVNFSINLYVFLYKLYKVCTYTYLLYKLLYRFETRKLLRFIPLHILHKHMSMHNCIYTFSSFVLFLYTFSFNVSNESLLRDTDFLQINFVYLLSKRLYITVNKKISFYIYMRYV